MVLALRRSDALDQGLGLQREERDVGLRRAVVGEDAVRDAAGDLRQPLLQLLTVVIAGRRFDLAADLLDAGLNVLGRPGALDDRYAAANAAPDLGARVSATDARVSVWAPTARTVSCVIS